jgi:hypothetical protein
VDVDVVVSRGSNELCDPHRATSPIPPPRRLGTPPAAGEAVYAGGGWWG